MKKRLMVFLLMATIAGLTAFFLGGCGKPDAEKKTITIKGVEISIDLTRLDLSGKSLTNADIEPLVQMTNLGQLDLRNNQVGSISVLKTLTDLENLDLTGNPLSEEQLNELRAALPNCTILPEPAPEPPAPDPTIEIKGVKYSLDLTLLDLSGKNLTAADIEPLRQMTNLTYLNLSNNQIGNVSVLKTLTDLENLDLTGNPLSEEQLNELRAALPNCAILPEPAPKPPDPEPTIEIKGVKYSLNLTQLDLSGKNLTAADIEPLRQMTNLTYLNLSNNQIGNVNALSSLNKLTQLNLTNNQISSVSALNGLSNLTSLNLDSNQLSWKQVSDLQAALPKCQISARTEIKGVKYNLNLTQLDLSGKNLTAADIEPLRQMTNLAYLDLSNNQIGNINVLKTLTNLTQLNLTGSPLSEAQLNELRTALPNCTILPMPAEIEIKGMKYSTTLTSLYLNWDGLTAADIEPLKYMTNLTVLYLNNNQISDVSVLKNLTNLQYLYLNDNQISDISVLKNLTNLTGLLLASNQISDISALKDLANLTWLHLDNNQISDLSALKSLTKLESLFLKDNPLSEAQIFELWQALPTCSISPIVTIEIKGVKYPVDWSQFNLSGKDLTAADIEPLKYMVNLWQLDLSNNQISDLSALKNLPNLTRLDLSGNPISEAQIFELWQALPNCLISPAPTIEIKGVKYHADSTWLDLSGKGLTAADIEPLKHMTRLERLNLSNNQISDLSALKDMTNLGYLELYGNQISDIGSLKNLTNLWFLDLSGNPLTEAQINELKIALPGCMISSQPVIEIKGVKYHADSTRLDLSGQNLTAADIEPLKHMTRLERLYLNNNQISDLSALSGLTNLRYLYLSDNQISDLSPLSGLTNLGWLWLGGNPLGDPGFLKDLVNLRYLHLGDHSPNNPLSEAQINELRAALPNCAIVTSIEIKGIKYNTDAGELWLGGQGLTNSDIEPLKHMTRLERLDLGNNQISDISALKDLTNLQYLYLYDNRISDLSPLSGLTNLTSLNLDGNQISDLSPLGSLAKLDMLNSRNNKISDVSALKSLTSLRFLYLDDNQISDISALKEMTNLRILNLDGSPLSWEQIVELRTALPNCSISPGMPGPIEIKGVTYSTYLNELNLNGQGLTNSDIEPLKYMLLLERLYLEDNQISDVSALKGLERLYRLDLSDNPLSEAQINELKTALPNCGISSGPTIKIRGEKFSIYLTRLDLSSKGLTNADIEPLKHMVNLEYLDLWNNQISDLSALKDLTNLKFLYLGINQISDVSIFKNLNNLEHLELPINQISDISALKSLTNLTGLVLRGNPLNAAQINELRAALPNCDIYF